ncbi:molybdopterin-binding protein [Thermosulfurimonas sp.]|uniref:molybdopterin-binding protein n=1 Tax=Thermosulfurimonas sp. TaxID=2080236 RepID=UPI0025F90CE1|nr:molybdopterin-binding protein [Thermosulfurimonas sp.]
MRARTVPVEEAVGMVLPHDLTEIRPGEFKGPAFRKGHVVREEDIPHLKRLGKDHIYVLEIDPDELHEDQAALRLARAVAGEGVTFSEEVREGKVTFRAAREGLFKVDVEALYRINLLGEIALSSRHGNFWVQKGEPLAGGRAIPLVVKESLLEEVERIAAQSPGVLRVLPRRMSRAGLVITGNEVYYGRIQDAFAPVMLPKLRAYGLEVLGPEFVPDDRERIRQAIEAMLQEGVDLVLVTGGMSVDPDDVTRAAIADLNPHPLTYGAPVLPGNMFLVAYLGEKAILGVPACGMYHGVTILDLVLPRVLAGEILTRKDLAALGHGGYCLHCKECRFPVCPFGRG